MLKSVLGWLRLRRPENQMLGLSAVPVQMLGAAIRSLPDARLTDVPQRRAVPTPGGAMFLHFVRTEAPDTGRLYWKFSHARAVSADVFETTVEDHESLGLDGR